ncbi:SDR family NAD(P)-dependent oxidoreductase [Altererythrobacter sp. C41]|uniref:SDR family NAD(P)-dependent oxidoreductase n=1 Tax=Altererythrobacter sp. C41 TaxID=2806021 RepID=UPI001931E89E|nr:glucose 1-dehydrogenase [Altererythrobacter sp. C41]MBM0168485.1 glucose 1-dehydrogenase [Altererythrobacter sp. C41]
MTKLNGKVAIVTGAGRDIGRAVALELARQGAKVAINFRGNEENATATLAEIERAGGTAIKVRADVTKGDEVAQLVAEVRKAFGEEIHILANVAGGMVERRPLADMDEEFFNHVMQLNVTSTFLTTKAVVPHMPAGSAIVNFASQAGRDGGGPGACAYATSKGAVMTFTRSMAKELGPRGIRVNALCPGMIATTFHDTFTKDEVRKNVAAATPLRREGNSEEVAAATAWLASEDAAFVTGANIDINGGTFFS